MAFGPFLLVKKEKKDSWKLRKIGCTAQCGNFETFTYVSLFFRE